MSGPLFANEVRAEPSGRPGFCQPVPSEERRQRNDVDQKDHAAGSSAVSGKDRHMFKFIGGVAGIIFLIGLIVVIGLLALIF